jgi:hypothetical protein
MAGQRTHRARPARRRALELLASCRDGCTEAMMLAHGFTIEQMVELVRAGLASATAGRVVAGSRKIEVARERITEAGRRARSVKGALIDRRGDVSPQYHVRHLPRVRDL